MNPIRASIVLDSRLASSASIGESPGFACFGVLANGNKRTGAIAVFAFLDADGFDLRARPKALQDVAEAVAAGKMDKAALADWFRGNVRQQSSG